MVPRVLDYELVRFLGLLDNRVYRFLGLLDYRVDRFMQVQYKYKEALNWLQSFLNKN